jgi:hypothetical protein
MTSSIAAGYANIQTEDAIATLLNPELPSYSILSSLPADAGYSDFIEAAEAAGQTLTLAGYSWTDSAISIDEVEAEAFPNGLAKRMGWA